MDTLTARDARRAQLPGNVGQSWSTEKEATLIAAFKSGYSVAEIAGRHGRTVRAIETQLEKVGLLSSVQRSTGNSFIKVPPKDGRSPRVCDM